MLKPSDALYCFAKRKLPAMKGTKSSKTLPQTDLFSALESVAADLKSHTQLVGAHPLDEIKFASIYLIHVPRPRY
jgi:hypothetical protein